jgi:hypothetical protein
MRFRSKDPRSSASPEQQEGPPESLPDVAVWQERRLRALLAHQDRMHPEVRKVRERMYYQVLEIRRLVDRNGAHITEELHSHLRELLAREPDDSKSLDYAWELSDSLKSTLPQIADDEYLRVLLENEKVRDAKSWRLSWSSYLDPRELDDLVKAFDSSSATPSQRKGAVDRLVFLYDKRSDDGAHYRARMQLRSRYVAKAAYLLAPLVLGLMIATYLAGDDPLSTILLTGLAGAVGSTLAATRKLRDVITINDLRSTKIGTLSQPLVGAAAGLATLFLFSSGVVQLPGSGSESVRWAALAMYAFIAGFSEPFFLKAIEKIAGAADEKGAGAQTSNH